MVRWELHACFVDIYLMGTIFHNISICLPRKLNLDVTSVDVSRRTVGNSKFFAIGRHLLLGALGIQQWLNDQYIWKIDFQHAFMVNVIEIWYLEMD